MSIETQEIINELKKAVVGKDDVLTKVYAAILAGGHILIEDVPGVGKTTLAAAFSKVLGLSFKRLQFTFDTVASDITGYYVPDGKDGLIYREGAANTNILIADEINRTSSKTQAALLEVMEEGQITVDGKTKSVPSPFIVIATQNPVGSAGTQMLPPSQLDRFAIRLKMGYPDMQSQIDILRRQRADKPLDGLSIKASTAEVLQMQRKVNEIFASDEIYEYITCLVQATRECENIELGVSPRGALCLSKMARAAAFIAKRSYVVPQDVQSVFCETCAHRIVISQGAAIEGVTSSEILKEVLLKTNPPAINKKQ